MAFIDPRQMNEAMSCDLDNLLSMQQNKMYIRAGNYRINSIDYFLNCNLVREKINSELIIRVTPKFDFARGSSAAVYNLYGSLRKVDGLWVFNDEDETMIIKLFHKSNTTFKKIYSEERRSNTYAPELACRSMFFKNTGGLILKRVAGVDLTRFMDQVFCKDIKLSIHNRLIITHNLMLAVNQVHQRDGVHRDIKPDNLIIDPATFEVRVIDFAFACANGKNHKKNCAKGSPLYAPPEMMEPKKEKRVTQQSGDIYSLGIVLLIFWGYRFTKGYLSYNELKADLVKRAQDENIDGLFDSLGAIDNTIKFMLSQLFVNMTRYDPETRIGLSEAIKEINAIIEFERSLELPRWCNLL